MYSKYIAIFLAGISLVACASGREYSAGAADINKTPASGSRLIIYRPSSFALALKGGEIKIDGAQVCTLHSGGFTVKDVSAGKHTVSAEQWDFPGVSDVTVNTRNKGVHYVRVSPASAKIGMGAVGGAIAGYMSEENGPKGYFYMQEMTKAAAEAEITTLKQECQ